MPPTDYALLARQHGGTALGDDSVGMLAPGNIDLSSRPRVKNADGSISTVRSISVNMDGKEYLIPTVTDDGRMVSNDEAVKLFQKTGKHLGIFDSPEHATAYAQGLHSDQSKMVGQGIDYAALAKQHGGKMVEQAPEAPFPTPSQTAGTMAVSGLKAIPSMAVGAIQGATAPLTAPGRDFAAMFGKGSSPTLAQIKDSWAHASNALASGDAGPMQRLGELVQAVPTVGPMLAGLVGGAKTIGTPAYKAATGKLNEITPEEMNAAAETGGAAVAGLAVPELAKGAGMVSPGTIGKVLKFAAKEGTAHVMAPGSTLAGKLVRTFVLGPAMRQVNSIVQDALLEAIQKGDLPKAASVVSKAIERSPEAAAAHVESVASEMAPTAAPAPAAAAPSTPPARPDLPFKPGWSEEQIARQNAALAARRGTTVPETAPAAPEPPSAGMALPGERAASERPSGATYKTPVLPVKGETKLATVSQRPAPIEGKPLTPKQREMRLKQLAAAQAAGLDIFEAFGVQKP